ncbi:MAG: PilT/PilU family type 4a pilus ATPase [Melioribacteraceae bacterium]|nr:PilT/PilU family type 4a pilus ATPase [Melioribacteraceae bacterium]MCF8263758.1 PilT/PilU family type 4a pilus ATPase [Melioribacteraceae bacterium]MCF8412661.1 PilT/PilU family type 4a pilus ATPase [Melioribacteraceae bacterium]MCF8430631.1 PilT/PilU family type 4a pilus ATPase [Melioribacteraceae bacterium]
MINEFRNIAQQVLSKVSHASSDSERLLELRTAVSEISPNERAFLRKIFAQLLDAVVKNGASDIEIGGVGTVDKVWLRINGTKIPVDKLPTFSIDESTLLIFSILSQNQQTELLEKRNLDFSYSYLNNESGNEQRFRADVYFELGTVALNLRAISNEIRSLDSLGFHKFAVDKMYHENTKYGLSLITGITGSGKSSTLDSVIDYHNRTVNTHIIIIASPVEFIHKSKKSIVRHREVGSDVLSFSRGVIEAMRQDPDIVVIGEMRDPDTILASLEVADTGHKVFSTLHTSSAAESIDRILAEVDKRDIDRVRHRLADVLVSVVSQKLVPGISGGRHLVKEVMLMTPGIKAAIKNNNIGEIYMMINQSRDLGMNTLEQDLLRLYAERKISKETAVTFSNNRQFMVQMINRSIN